MTQTLIEYHPFPGFITRGMKCLLLGSFPGKEQTKRGWDENAWFYGAPLNQLWRILEKVYNVELNTKEAKQKLFREAGIGITDIFRSVIRKSGSNLDENLAIIEYNKTEIERVLKDFRPQVFLYQPVCRKGV